MPRMLTNPQRRRPGFQPWATKFVGMKEQILDFGPVMRLRKRIGLHFLEKEMEGLKRETNSSSLGVAKRIGVLFTGEDDATLKAVSQFIDQLRKEGKSVRSMGYVPREKVAETLRTSSGLEFFTQTDLNWYFRPQSRHAVSFIEEPFDLLIDLRMKRRMPIPYMVALSMAKFKVGCYHEDDDGLHDLMIRVEDGMDMEELIDHLRHYLEMVGQKK